MHVTSLQLSWIIRRRIADIPFIMGPFINTVDYNLKEYIQKASADFHRRRARISFRMARPFIWFTRHIDLNIFMFFSLLQIFHCHLTFQIMGHHQWLATV
ncbi:hypothetical protein T07_708 [Trichinella nelsoni]|uniref:Uncharacterized protein n=1 Tax=Trichinella nelsoni TaxID=6336 RepID=A0A0V0SGK9_9BILA|nr:hypothetical protein T07_708 [Trichinella nelsoni]